MVDQKLPISVHLEEIRKRLIVYFFFLGVFSSVSFMFMESLLDILKRPAGDLVKQFAVFSPTAGIISMIKIAVASGVIFSLPVLFYQIWRFVLPAMNPQLKKKGGWLISLSSFLFLCGASLSYFLLIPASLRFLLNVGKHDLLFLISLDAYSSFVLALIFGGGIIFEMPLGGYLLARGGILTSKQMISGWRFAAIIILIAAALITPTPDVVNMLLMAVPMVFLYGLSIYSAKLAEGRK